MQQIKLSTAVLIALFSSFSLSSNASLSHDAIQKASQVAEILQPSLSTILEKNVKLTGITLQDGLPENHIEIANPTCSDYLLASNYADLYEIAFSVNFGRDNYKDFNNPVANAIKTLSLGTSSQHMACLMKEKGFKDEGEVAIYLVDHLEELKSEDKRFEKLEDFELVSEIEATLNKMVENAK